MTRLAVLSLLFLLALSTCFSQAPAKIIKGVVVSAATGEAVPYATIRLAHSGISTISNEKGRFIFKIPAVTMTGDRFYGDSIYISQVGYRPVAFVFHPSDTSRMTLRLQEEIKQLSEVVVKIPDPLDLLNKAIAKIPENYPSAPYMTSGFYRVTGRKEKSVIDLSEAVFNIYNESYAAKSKQFKLIKSRLDKDLTAFNGRDDVSMGMDPNSILVNDVVSSWQLGGVLSEEGLKIRQYAYKGMINYNGRQAYVIAFDLKDGIKKPLNAGRVIIDADNLAFLEFKLWVSPKGLPYWEPGGFAKRMLMKLFHVQVKLMADTMTVTYQPYGPKYYLNHILWNAYYHISSESMRLNLNPLHYHCNYVITNIDTAGAIPFTKDEILSDSKSIEGQSPDRHDSAEDAFWGNYNYLVADFNVDSTVKIIRADNETLNYKRLLRKNLAKYKAENAARIDSILSFYHHKDQFTGTALVKYKGKIIYEKAFGLADRENNIPNSTQTGFRIGSMAKQFTALLIMQLVNENLLSVRDTIGKFIPGYRNGGVTIEQLLTHQSGIPNYTGINDYLLRLMSHRYTLNELVTDFCSDSLEFTPGSRMEYSNSNYTILADIVEKLTRRHFGEVLVTKIFTPAGMNNSFSGTKDSLLIHTPLAKGYVYDEPETPYPLENVTGAGGITSTVEDLLHWDNALSSGLLLPPDKIAELFKPRVEWNEWDAYYGFGWMIDRFLFQASQKHTIQYHPGTEFGLYSILARQPDKDIVIILLNNTGDFPRFDITDLVLDVLN